MQQTANLDLTATQQRLPKQCIIFTYMQTTNEAVWINIASKSQHTQNTQPHMVNKANGTNSSVKHSISSILTHEIINKRKTCSTQLHCTPYQCTWQSYVDLIDSFTNVRLEHNHIHGRNSTSNDIHTLHAIRQSSLAYIPQLTHNALQQTHNINQQRNSLELHTRSWSYTTLLANVHTQHVITTTTFSMLRPPLTATAQNN